MPHSYSALWVHLIWSTKNREPLLLKPFRLEVFKLIKSITNDHEIYLDCINGIDDHVHLLIRLRTDQSVAEVVKIIKALSWEYYRYNEETPLIWQDGFAAFSVSPDNLSRVRGYIYNQEKHHQTQSFSDELKNIKETTKSKSA